MTKKYWKYYMVDGDCYQCRICQRELKVQKDGGCSHLRQHLKNFHNSIFQEILMAEAMKPQRIPSTSNPLKRPYDPVVQFMEEQEKKFCQQPVEEGIFEGWPVENNNLPGNLQDNLWQPSGAMSIFGIKQEEPEMSNVITVECREQPIERVIVFNDRAEVKRLIATELAPGENIVHVQNISQAFVHDSVRVDGKGDVVIHEVRTKVIPALQSETDSPKVAELRARLETKKDEVNTLTDRVSVLNKRVEALDKVVVDLGTGILPKDGQLDVNGGVLESISKFYSFYDKESTTIRQELRQTQAIQTKAEEERNKLQQELNQAEYEQNTNSQRIFAISLESQGGGKVQLDVVYQVYQANWTPSYDFRVDTTGEKPSIQVSYYGEINQSTGEDWTDVPLILSTAQPCLGGEIPELGTLEVSIYQPPPPAPCPPSNSYGGGYGAPMVCRTMAAPMAMMADAECFSVKKAKRAVATVEEQALSTEFNIVKNTTIPSCNESTKVTIGIFELHPQLVHECVPSRNRSVFLTASTVNTSNLPLIVGQAAVYLNNSFVTNTMLKNVSPGERFACSLGVDSAIRVDYRPVKKYGEQQGIISKSSSIITEQIINVRNTRNTSILLVVKEHIPRSTDEKIKIRVIHPSPINTHEAEKTVGEVPAHSKEGYVLNHKNNLEWTLKLGGGAVQDLVLKYAVDHPKEEKLEFAEKY